MSKLRISGYVNDSIVDGPGLRFTIFTQGCPHHCEGCHNPQTHDPKGGHVEKIDKIWKLIQTNPLLSGVTLSGGEPFAQAEALLPLVKLIHASGLEIAAYSGYHFEELISGNIPRAKELLSYVDVLIDGRFILSQRSLDLKFKGSKNQRTINVQESLQKGKIILETSARWTK